MKTYSMFHRLYKNSEMTVFESILTTFVKSIIFRGSSNNWLELKIEPS